MADLKRAAQLSHAATPADRLPVILIEDAAAGINDIDIALAVVIFGQDHRDEGGILALVLVICRNLFGHPFVSFSRSGRLAGKHTGFREVFRYRIVAVLETL